MRKNELIRETSKRTGYTIGVCDEIITECFQVMLDTLAGYEEIRMPGIGILEVKDKKARDYYDVNTNQIMRSSDSKQLKFRASSVIKEMINS